jgi:hypothetical protein
MGADGPNFLGISELPSKKGGGGWVKKKEGPGCGLCINVGDSLFDCTEMFERGRSL